MNVTTGRWRVSATRRESPAHYVAPQETQRHNYDEYVQTACGRRMNWHRLVAVLPPEDRPAAGEYCRTCRDRSRGGLS